MPGGGFAFDAYLLDTRSKRLLRGGEVVSLTVRQYDILHTLVRNAGQVVDLDTLMKAAWRDVIVNESSIHKIVSELRRAFDGDKDGYICNRRRHGYYFAGTTTVADLDEIEVDLDVLIEPHRIWIEGRALLETLTLDAVRAARAHLNRSSHGFHATPISISVSRTRVRCSTTPPARMNAPIARHSSQPKPKHAWLVV